MNLDTARKSNPTHFPRVFWRALLPILAGALLLFCLFVWWLARRAGPDYLGAPETILPHGTAALASWPNFGSFLQRMGNLNAVREMQQDENIAALLLTDPAWRKIQKEKDKARYKVLSAMAGDFVEKWLSQEVSLAIIPPEQRALEPSKARDQTGLIAIARTRIGFEENLAELVAHLYPDLALEKRLYRGHALYRFNAQRSRSAFSYCRFGNTIILSLRNPDWHWLEQIVDMKKGIEAGAKGSLYSTVSLAANAEFREAKAKRPPTSDGLSAYLIPARISSALAAFPGDISEARNLGFWLRYLDPRLKQAQWGRIDLFLNQGLRMQSFWKSADKTSPSKQHPPVESRLGAVLHEAPLDAPLFFQLQSSRLKEFAMNFHGYMRNSRTYKKDLAEFEKDWQTNTGTRFLEDWVESLSGSCGLIIRSMQSALLFPVPEAMAWWDMPNPVAARRLVAKLEKSEIVEPKTSFFLGPIGFAQKGSKLLALANATASTGTLSPGQTLADQPLLRDLARNGGPEPVVCLYVNFRSSYAHLNRMVHSAAIWSADVRGDLSKWTRILSVLQYTDAMLLTAIPKEEGIVVDLVVPIR